MTPTPDAEQWQRIEAMFDELSELPEAQREARLAHADPAVAERVRRLLAAARDSDRLFGAPADGTPRADETALEAHTRIGAYRIESLIGRGGMGEVYRAQRADGQFVKPVALKLMRAEVAAQPEQFHNERQILATLEHPGIARLLDGGLASDGRPYMVMELVEGRNLVDYCDEHRLDLHARLALFIQVCEAVGYAHRHLVVHRDLKPGNILVTAEGQVKLLDFGIAKLLDPLARADTGVTAALLTPDYAAPEQLEGLSPTTATDVYALGAVLYRLLSGALPWNLRELPLPAALQRLLHNDAGALDQAAAANPDAPVDARLLRGDLAAIVAKALRREAEERYASAAALASEVRRYLAHEPVQARGGARGYLVRRFLRRNWLWAGATAAVLMALLAGLAGTAWEERRASAQRDLYRSEVSHTEAALHYLALMFRDAHEHAGNGPVTAKQVLETSAAQLDEQLADKPEERAQVLLFVGKLYAELDDFVRRR